MLQNNPGKEGEAGKELEGMAEQYWSHCEVLYQTHEGSIAILTQALRMFDILLTKV